ncbi:MAG: hypothetical protein Q4A41_04250 [Bacillota bacterium]|nr:hypothetical protein [Bacillota bacterium]
MEAVKILAIVITILIISLTACYIAFDLFRISKSKKKEEKVMREKRRQERLADKERQAIRDRYRNADPKS